MDALGGSSSARGGSMQGAFDALSLAGTRANAAGDIDSAWSLYAACDALGGGSAPHVSAANMLLKEGRASEARAEYDAMLSLMGGGTLSPKQVMRAHCRRPD